MLDKFKPKLSLYGYFGLVVAAGLAVLLAAVSANPKQAVYLLRERGASVAASVRSPFHYDFRVNGTLEEAPNMEKSSSPYFWLNSGGLFILKDGIGQTIQEELPSLQKWRLAYLASNPRDTDQGYHPQNILRLVTRSRWQNFQQEIYFQITKLNLSSSSERNSWSGILLFNRYQDENNLYYTGIRTDGHAIIKKKINGVYYTLAEKPFYTSNLAYNRDTNPNLIPGAVWIGLRSVIRNNPDGTVSIQLFIDKDKNGQWILAAETRDDSRSFGGPAITNAGYAGLRTDFLDVLVDDLRLQNLQ